MKKVLVALLIFLLIGVFALWFIHTPLPKGTPGPRAEALADEMLEAIGYHAWVDIPLVAWTFRGTNHYVWDKDLHVAQVKWDDLEVVLDLSTQEGRAWQSGAPLTGDEAQSAIDKAYASWCNDSFWLNAPAKVRDGGTERSLVTLDGGREALLVKYHSGGVTPGDAYLWVPGADGLPEYFQMWVSIIPVGGIKATWEDWEVHDGALIARTPKLGPAEVTVDNVRTGRSPVDFNLPEDYFSGWGSGE